MLVFAMNLLFCPIKLIGIIEESLFVNLLIWTNIKGKEGVGIIE